MSVQRLQTHNFQKPTPVKGEAAPQVATPAGVNGAEAAAAQKLQQVVQGVGVDVLDAFLQARQGKAPERGLFPSLQRLLGGAKPEVSREALQLQQSVGETLTTLGNVYADGHVAEHELSALNSARAKMQAVLGLADPAVLQMLPKDVREKLQNQLLEPLSLIEAAATRRSERVFTQVAERDEGALRQKMAETTTVCLPVDVKATLQAGLPLNSARRYGVGDLVAVPRSDGTLQKGVVVGHDPQGLRVELVDPRSGAFAMKTVGHAEIERANPAKIGDSFKTGGFTVFVTGVSAGNVSGKLQEGNGRLRDIGAKELAELVRRATHEAGRPAASGATAQTLLMTQAMAVGGAGAASPVRSSKQSLEQVLDTVWNDKASFLSGAKDVYSAVYNAVAEANPLSKSKVQMLDEIAGIAAGRPAGFTSNTQSFGGGGGDHIKGVVEMYKSGQMPATGPIAASKLEGTFFRFERGPQWQPEKISQRVYLNASADHATSLMKFVVAQILDNPAKFPGVEMTKLSGPGAVGDRSENIVIYTHGDDASKRVLDAIEGYKAQHPTHFKSGVPAFTEQVAPGVATGDEPAIGKGSVSFGSLRSSVIEGALEQAHKRGLDRQGFGKLVAEGLLRSQVDPQRPHKNLVVARGLQ